MHDVKPRPRDQFRQIGRAAIGRRRDWTVAKPRFRGLALGNYLGPLLVTISVVVGWFAFSGAQGEEGGSVALGLFVGAASIVLMAWSFLLAVRIKFLEPLFGGLDRMYQVHRWAGTLAVIAMFLHVRLEPEVEGGILGASRSVADTAEGLAGVAEYLIYGLVAISLIRWFPYRFWRLTHKALGIPFAFASWHFYTAEKTYANGSPWGWYFGTIMVGGLVAYLYRVVVLDMIRRGRAYRVTRAEVRGQTMEVELSPKGRKLQHQAGQFAVLKVQRRGLTEPHLFTIASSPDSPNLRFYIRNLGDWTNRLLQQDLTGTEVLVEGPYGEFEPLPHGDRPVLWIAGGVGITPFLSATDSLPPAPAGHRPTLVYCVRHRHDATAIEALEAAAADGRIDLHLLVSSEGQRFSADYLEEFVADRSLADTHVAVCGPASLVSDAARAAMQLGAPTVETEAFDIRSGIGPDLSQPIDDLVASRSTPSADQPTPSSVGS